MRERGEFASKDKLDQSGRGSLLDGFNISSSSPLALFLLAVQVANEGD